MTPWASPPRSVTWALRVRIRGHDSWDGSQYQQKGRWVSRQYEGIMEECETRSPSKRSSKRSEVRVVRSSVELKIIQSPSSDIQAEKFRTFSLYIGWEMSRRLWEKIRICHFKVNGNEAKEIVFQNVLIFWEVKKLLKVISKIQSSCGFPATLPRNVFFPLFSSTWHCCRLFENFSSFLLVSFLLRLEARTEVNSS